MSELLQKAAQNIARIARTLARWLLMAAVIGGLCGAVGTAFHLAVDKATELRGTHTWFLYLLPFAGLAIVALYKLTGTEGMNTDDVIDAVQDGKPVALLLLPAIFIGTVLTHLTGGSAGREGAALQMGGDIGWQTGKLLRLSEHSCRTATLCGMAAFFTALFGTPLAATLFAMMVVNVGLVFYATFLPALASSLVAYAISLALGVPPTRYTVAAPGWDLFTAARTAGLGLACALVTLLFCGVMHLAHRLLAKYLPNPWLRALAGGAAVIALTLLCGSMRYNGAGGDVIAQAVEQGQALPLDFLFKILFTALTLGAGYKGGEVVPSFFVGATFGCVAAPLLGLPAGFGAALGLAAVFCGATNCLVPSIVLAVELFGAPGLLYYAIACGISYALSGYTGLYSHQTFLTDKLMPEYRAEIHPHHARAPQPGAPGESGEHQAP